jgi:hypothetical protein
MRLPPTAGISVSEQLRKVPLAVRPIVRSARRMVKARVGSLESQATK